MRVIALEHWRVWCLLSFQVTWSGLEVVMSNQWVTECLAECTSVKFPQQRSFAGFCISNCRKQGVIYIVCEDMVDWLPTYARKECVLLSNMSGFHWSFVGFRRVDVDWQSCLGKSVLPLRLAKTGPLFHVVAFWSRFKKFCFHSKNKLCAFPIFGLSCVKRRPTHVFIILTSRSFRTNSPFALSSTMSTTKPLRKLAIYFFFVFSKKRVLFWTRVWLRLRLRESSPPLGDPRFRLSAFESTFPWKRDTVHQNTNLPSNGHENAAFRVLFPAVGARSNGGCKNGASAHASPWRGNCHPS